MYKLLIVFLLLLSSCKHVDTQLYSYECPTCGYKIAISAKNKTQQYGHWDQRYTSDHEQPCDCVILKYSGEYNR